MAQIRNAATVLIASRAVNKPAPTLNSNAIIGPAEDFSLVFLKRSHRSRFMPNAVVFPGGAHDFADCNPNWWKVLQNTGLSKADLKHRFSYTTTSTSTKSFRPSIYSEMDSKSTTNNISQPILSPEISLRLTALRETFEETGLLLACEMNRFDKPIALTDNNLMLGGGKTLQQWRDDVRKRPELFKELFATTSIIPWLDGLVEWWGWYTPQFISTVKYNTIFYTACLVDEQLQQQQLSCCEESDMLQVETPSVLLQEWREGKCFLGPPQMYELSALTQHTSLHELHESTESRVHINGSRCAEVQVWQPQLYGAYNGMISILPGDHFYSSTYPPFNSEGSPLGESAILGVSKDGKPYLDLDIEDLRYWRPEERQTCVDESLRLLYEGFEKEADPSMRRLNRIEIKGAYDAQVMVSVEGNRSGEQLYPKKITYKDE